MDGLKSDVMSWSARIGLAALSLATLVTGGSAKTTPPFGTRATDADRDVARVPDNRGLKLADDDANSNGGGHQTAMGVRG